MENFQALLQLDPCEDKIEWIKFLALGCSMLGGVRTYMNNSLWSQAWRRSNVGVSVTAENTFMTLVTLLERILFQMPAVVLGLQLFYFF